MAPASISELLAAAPLKLDRYEDLYRHLHAHPELSNLEEQTAASVAAWLETFGVFAVHTKIGGHGLAAVWENGPGPKILLRADMDALPVEEQTGLPYASSKKMLDLNGKEQAVMHACGHDMHMTCLLAAAETLVQLRGEWSGTLLLVFQPEEERGTGARAMVEGGGLYAKIPVPDVVLGQHVMAQRAGRVGSKVGTIMAAADSYRVTLFGRGGHGSLPHMTIDPAVMAAQLVVRLQGIVSRQVDPSDMAVVTVGSLHVGQVENIIADRAELGIDIRSVRPATRAKLIAAVRRMVHAEYVASGATREPLIVQTRAFPTTDNDRPSAERLAGAFAAHFGDAFEADTPRVNASEDVSILASSCDRPCVFWFWGGVHHQLWDENEAAGTLYENVPGNHSPFFAPVIQPTMRTGIDALCVAALTFLWKASE